MRHEQEVHQPQPTVDTKDFSPAMFLLPETQFVVKPILHEYLYPIKNTTENLDLASTARTEVLLMQQDPSSEAYQALLHQYAFTWTAALLTSNHNPEIVALYQQSDEAYGVGAVMNLVPTSWKKHIIDHGDDHPIPPHLQPQLRHEQESSIE